MRLAQNLLPDLLCLPLLLQQIGPRSVAVPDVLRICLAAFSFSRADAFLFSALPNPCPDWKTNSKTQYCYIFINGVRSSSHLIFLGQLQPYPTPVPTQIPTVSTTEDHDCSDCNLLHNGLTFVRCSPIPPQVPLYSQHPFRQAHQLMKGQKSQPQRQQTRYIFSFAGVFLYFEFSFLPLWIIIPPTKAD